MKEVEEGRDVGECRREASGALPQGGDAMDCLVESRCEIFQELEERVWNAVVFRTT